MATGSDNPSTFAEQSKYWLEKTYGNWKETLSASLEEKVATICIPDALDVLPGRRLDTRKNAVAQVEQEFKEKEKQAYRRDIAGQAGEEKFSTAFRQLQLGGILILGFNTEEYIKKMNCEGVTEINLSTWKDEKRHFECDAIFLHLRLGIFVIETKGCDDKKSVGKRFNTAVAQLDRRIPGMEDVFHKVTGSTVCPLKIRGVICIPNHDVIKTHSKYKVLGKKEIESPNLREYWLSMKETSQANLENSAKELSFDEKDKLYTFIATIIGYRSAKFSSLMSNALEIYRMIDKQDFSKCKTVIEQKYVGLDQGPILLNNEQLSIVETTEPHIIIYGPPGTGKSTILLLRALSSARMDKPGRVIIFLANDNRMLKQLFQKIIDKNWNDSYKRKIEVSIEFEDLQMFNDNDDLFIDEMHVEIDGMVESLNGRIPASEDVTKSRDAGTTTVVVTGRWQIDHMFNIDYLNTFLSHLPNFHPIQMNTVIRGTLSIIKEWQSSFSALPNQFITFGHNVQGGLVEKIPAKDREHLFCILEEIVCELLPSKGSMCETEKNSLFFGMLPEHIAILNGEHDNWVAIAQRLGQKGHPCGNIHDQIEQRDLIAIGHPIMTLSFDWPVVIYVDFPPDGNVKHKIFACSRCISKLYILSVTNPTVADINLSTGAKKEKKGYRIL